MSIETPAQNLYMGPRLVPHDTFERIYHQAFQTKS